jgi:restriction system protein
MNIWNYNVQTRDALLPAMRSSACMFCLSALHHFPTVEDRKPWGDWEEWKVRVCQVCGWWKVEHWSHLEEGNLYIGDRSAAAGSLRHLDLTNVETPLQEVRKFLAAKYTSRFAIDPYLFEKTVGSVFKDLGYEFLVTSRSGDEGIDVLLHRHDEVIGVQVKRYQTAIKVGQIRELVGALVLKKFTKGMFVTLDFSLVRMTLLKTRKQSDWNFR